MSVELAIKNISQPASTDYYSAQAAKATEGKAGAKKDASDAKRDLPPKEVERIASEMQIHLKRLNTELRLEVDSGTKKVVVKVIDPDNGQIIRQVPSEEMLDISKRMDEIIGVLFNKKT